MQQVKRLLVMAHNKLLKPCSQDIIGAARGTKPVDRYPVALVACSLPSGKAGGWQHCLDLVPGCNQQTGQTMA
jgi:hypothetical protein